VRGSGEHGTVLWKKADSASDSWNTVTRTIRLNTGILGGYAEALCPKGHMECWNVIGFWFLGIAVVPDVQDIRYSEAGRRGSNGQ
jgi:hypothetical protein